VSDDLITARSVIPGQRTPAEAAAAPAQEEAQLLDALEPSFPRQRRTADVVVLVPAHNEQEWIERTIRSLQQQTRPVSRIVVMADNCTDRTVALARAAGAEVHATVDNTARKAGAINQGFDLVAPTLEDHDIVMTMDADGVLAPDCVEEALRVFDERERVGGVCAAALCRPQNNFLEAAQAIEYAKSRRITARRQGRVFVLSGCASFFPVDVLRQVANARGKTLPGEFGKVTVEDSLVEDYELTLAVKKLGFSCISSGRATVVTDVMPTIDDFEAQRLRWIRGTFETLRLYGWGRHTRRTMVSLAFNMFTAALLLVALLAMVVGYLAYGGEPVWWFLLLTPVFMVENILMAHRIGTWRAKLLAWSFFPMWAYDLAQAVIYWRSFAWVVSKRRQEW
jgi:biofilm PGA synthesis N-glycosyltransferase PgaC